MTKRTEENIVAVIFLVIFIAVIIMSMGYGVRARLVPLPIASGSAVLVLAQLILQNTKKNVDFSVDASELFRGSKTGQAVQDEKSKTGSTDLKVKKIGGGNEWRGLGLVGIYFLIILLIGIMPAVFIFVLGYFLFVAKIKWIRALLYSVLCEVAIYVLFVMLLQVQMYQGWLISLLG